jgi:hypothetical protein
MQYGCQMGIPRVDKVQCADHGYSQPAYGLPVRVLADITQHSSMMDLHTLEPSAPSDVHVFDMVNLRSSGCSRRADVIDFRHAQYCIMPATSTPRYKLFCMSPLMLY